MFEIVSEVAVERLKLIFPNEDTREVFLKSQRKTKEYAIVDWRINKLSFDIDYLDKFRVRYPDYEYEVNFVKTGFRKTKAKSFSVWGAIIEREVVEHQFIYRNLNEVS